MNLFKNKNCTVILDKLNNTILQNYKKIRIKEIYEKNSKFINESDDAKKFKKWIDERNERKIAVISHGTFISRITYYFPNNCEFQIWHPDHG